MTGGEPPAADVGGWFRTATPGARRPVAAWQPSTGFGRTSPDADVVAAAEDLRGRPTMFLTGAGMSTASGLPDYRGPDAVVRFPMTYQEFVGSEAARRRYWARSTVGWLSFGRAEPNDAHRLLARLEGRLPVTAVVTQNVDRLHQLAGSRDVVELHGSLERAVCLDCGRFVARDDLQRRLLELNPVLAAALSRLAADSAPAPDGDAEVDQAGDFSYPACPGCGGILKPDVVFFGENARPEVVARAFDALERAAALVVLGSSLTVMSGLRFVRRARRDGKPVVIVNDGDTRGDDLATRRLHGRLLPVLNRWEQVLEDAGVA